MHLLPESDEELMRRVVLSKDQHAFRAIVERHKAFGMTLAVRILNDEHLAEEALQDAFLRVWRSAHTFTFSSAFKTWFYRILHNVALSKLKKEKNDDLPLETLGDSPANTPHADLDMSSLIVGSIDKLPIMTKTVITLFYLQELSIEEISEICEIPQGTVKTHLFRGREKLRKDVSLKEHYYG